MSPIKRKFGYMHITIRAMRQGLTPFFKNAEKVVRVLAIEVKPKTGPGTGMAQTTGNRQGNLDMVGP